MINSLIFGFSPPIDHEIPLASSNISLRVGALAPFAEVKESPIAPITSISCKVNLLTEQGRGLGKNRKKVGHLNFPCAYSVALTHELEYCTDLSDKIFEFTTF